VGAPVTAGSGPVRGVRGDRAPQWEDGRPIVPGDPVEWQCAGVILRVDVLGISDRDVPVRVRGEHWTRWVDPSALTRTEEQ
jgi:hypothetical protein